MKKIGFIFLLFSIVLQSQNKLDSKIRVLYVSNYLESKKPNLQKIDKTVVLIAGTDESVFLTANSYTSDSLKLENRGIEEVMKYYEPQYQYEILVNKREINFYDSILNTEIGYSEPNKMSWTLEKEYKNILGVKCQKATLAKYGRKWIAFFSMNYPFPFGPYKFNGLPGLILEVHDLDNEFNFTAVEIKTFKKDYPISKVINVKKFSKDDFLKAKNNLESDFTFGGKIKLAPESAKLFTDKYKENRKFENPIEINN
ncbi:GLPGLI family protein [Halpernia frigidisoli]|uniref:GLPGLI family protein n=1 Tax=Halpernia frigidisoli TaxID=1125876 RepID=A0A1I3I1P8_9FLAO|nr:GLPGLI family protein [Halpernia frigidisoli]SFI41757.1 GLPGLI family protein [Halpernia frigidisoli]